MISVLRLNPKEQPEPKPSLSRTSRLPFDRLGRLQQQVTHADSQFQVPYVRTLEGRLKNVAILIASIGHTVFFAFKGLLLCLLLIFCNISPSAALYASFEVAAYCDPAASKATSSPKMQGTDKGPVFAVLLYGTSLFLIVPYAYLTLVSLLSASHCCFLSATCAPLSAGALRASLIWEALKTHIARLVSVIVGLALLVALCYFLLPHHRNALWLTCYAEMFCFVAVFMINKHLKKVYQFIRNLPPRVFADGRIDEIEVRRLLCLIATTSQ